MGQPQGEAIAPHGSGDRNDAPSPIRWSAGLLAHRMGPRLDLVGWRFDLGLGARPFAPSIDRLGRDGVAV